MSPFVQIIKDFLSWPGTETLIKLIGLIAVLVAAWFAFKRAKAMDKQTIAMQEQLTISRRSQITEQFNKAVEQLSHEKTEVRIGGLYTLNRLLGDEITLCENILQIIASYIQSYYTPFCKTNQALFPITFFNDFFQRVALPKGFKSDNEIKNKILQALKNAGHVDDKGFVIDTPKDIFQKIPIDPGSVVEKVDVLGSGIDADDIIIFILKMHFFALTKPKTDVSVAFSVLTSAKCNSGKEVHISDSRLNHIVLTDLRLNRFNFSRSIFLGSDLSFSAFIECNLSDVNFEGCHMHCSSFLSSNLNKANFKYSATWASGRKDYNDKGKGFLEDNRKICFKKSVLEFTDFRFSILYSSDFRETQHFNSQFGHCRLDKSNFCGATLSNCQFGDAQLHSCIFQNTNISGCSFHNASLIGSDFSNCFSEPIAIKKNSKCFSPTIFYGANLERVNFENSSLCDVDFRGAINLTIEQIVKVKTLKGAKFDEQLHKQILEHHSYLFE